MKKLLILSSVTATMCLSSCGFLTSKVGEEIVVDAAQEVIKVEEEVVHPDPLTPQTPSKTTSTSTKSTSSTKTTVTPTKEAITSDNTLKSVNPNDKK